MATEVRPGNLTPDGGAGLPPPGLPSLGLASALLERLAMLLELWTILEDDDVEAAWSTSSLIIMSCCVR